MSKLMVTASTHPAKNEILDYVKFLQDNSINVSMLHVDIMDGEFVEDKTWDYEMVKEINKITTIPMDCHLMVKNPLEVVEKYIESGVNILTVHYESFKNEKDLEKCLKLIKNKGCLAGISIKPATRVSQIARFLPLLDLVLVMSVEPGKSGQKFMPEAVNKISALRNMIDQSGRKTLIEVDGGINIDTVEKVKNAGVDMIVCGSALYNSTDKNFLINELTK